MPEADSEWLPYSPPQGSLVELFPDGTFLIDGVEKRFQQEDEVHIENTTLCARKEAGANMPLSLLIYHGTTPSALFLTYDDFEGTGFQWYRQDLHHGPSRSASPSKSFSQRSLSTLRALPYQWNTDRLFKLAFAGFLLWYLFLYHAVFKGTPAEERYPGTTLHTNANGEAEFNIPPERTIGTDNGTSQ